jgi:hypothetical protein
MTARPPDTSIAEDENLKVFYRAMTTEELLMYRAALTLDLQQVAGRSSKAHSVAFCQHRRRLVAEVLTERGVEALN